MTKLRGFTAEHGTLLKTFRKPKHLNGIPISTAYFIKLSSYSANSLVDR
jgi:hypothetical protein